MYGAEINHVRMTIENLIIITNHSSIYIYSYKIFLFSPNWCNFPATTKIRSISFKINLFLYILYSVIGSDKQFFLFFFPKRWNSGNHLSSLHLLYDQNSLYVHQFNRRAEVFVSVFFFVHIFLLRLSLFWWWIMQKMWFCWCEEI